ncbi:MAG: hypothetical protein U0V75_09535 [Ferruginibacter sp.]
MKKRVLTLLAVLAAAFLVAYFVIAPPEKHSNTVQLQCTQTAFTRFLLNKKKWPQWWPGKIQNDSTLEYSGLEFSVQKVLLNGILFSIKKGDEQYSGRLDILPADSNLCTAGFTTAFDVPSGIMERFRSYGAAKEINAVTDHLLTDLQSFFNQQENVYGMKVERQKVTDTMLISTSRVQDHYPSTTEVYDMLASLKQYILSVNGKETNPPMLNVYKEDSTRYNVMVAIPTAALLPATEIFKPKRMVPGYILVGDVKGGIAVIKKAEEEMYNYVIDYGKSSPAIPFQSLLTNRQQEPDSSKWITRLYYPVMY